VTNRRKNAGETGLLRSRMLSVEKEFESAHSASRGSLGSKGLTNQWNS
jgi:hypothetical protein